MRSQSGVIRTSIQSASLLITEVEEELGRRSSIRMYSKINELDFIVSFSELAWKHATCK